MPLLTFDVYYVYNILYINMKPFYQLATYLFNEHYIMPDFWCHALSYYWHSGLTVSRCYLHAYWNTLSPS
jgi:hypothetical protein